MVIKKIKTTLFILFISISSTSLAQDDLIQKIQDRVGFWRKIAFTCTSPSGFKFPSGEPDSGSVCEDGDMNLFAGLLCAAGDSNGCDLVRRSQYLGADDNYGRWYRSPRRMEIKNDLDGDGRLDEYESKTEDNDKDGRFGEKEWNTFSYDMALGTMLYLASLHNMGGANVEQAKVLGQLWFDWIHKFTPCAINGLEDHCIQRGWPRFCWNPPTEKIAGFGPCDLRPYPIADYAMLAEFQSYLGLTLPNGRLRGGLSTDDGKAVELILLRAKMNEEGFSEHLVGADLFLMRLMGRDKPELHTAAEFLNCNKPVGLERINLDPKTCRKKDPENAFFLYLRDGPTEQVKKAILDYCPAPDRLPEWRGDWIWQRGTDDENTWKPHTPWKRSMLWDCIFMARLVGVIG